MKKYQLFKNLFLIFIVLILIISCSENRQTINDSAKQGLKNIERFKFEKAIKNFEDAILSESENERYYFYLGYACLEHFRMTLPLKKNKTERNDLLLKAEKAFKKSIEINSDIAISYEGLADLNILKDNYQKSLEYLKVAIKKKGDEKRIHKKLGELYLKLKKPDLAKKEFALASGNSGTKKKDTNIYQLRSVERFPIKYDNDGNSIKATFESDIQWVVHDQLIFDSVCGDSFLANEILKGLYPAELKSVRYGMGDFNEKQHEASVKKIISTGNEYYQLRYGIKIIDLKLKVINDEN